MNPFDPVQFRLNDGGTALGQVAVAKLESPPRGLKHMCLAIPGKVLEGFE